MNKKIIGLGAIILVIAAAVYVFVLQSWWPNKASAQANQPPAVEETALPTGVANEGAEQSMESQDSEPIDPMSDPQKLMIPRWFLTSLMLDGQAYELGDIQMSLQFEVGGSANGQGACNGFGTTYEAGPGSKMTFGPIMSTKMACEPGMDLETAYFQALEKVTMFRTEDFKVFLASEDGQTSLVFSMPPK